MEHLGSPNFNLEAKSVVIYFSYGHAARTLVLIIIKRGANHYSHLPTYQVTQVYLARCILALCIYVVNN